MILCDVPTEGSWKHNETSAQVVADTVNAMVQAGVSLHQIGVITPFRRQCAAITSLLRENMNTPPVVDTIERFQGDERAVIILDLTASQKKDVMAAYQNDETMWQRKCNVAISRAQWKIIVIVNHQGYAQDPIIDQYARMATCV